MNKIKLALLVGVITAALLCTACGETEKMSSEVKNSYSVESEAALGEGLHSSNEVPGGSTDEEAEEEPAEEAAESLDAIMEEYVAAVEEEVEGTLSVLQADYELLTKTVDSYEAYVSSYEEIESFYLNIVSETEAVCNRISMCSADYLEQVMNSGMEPEEMHEYAKVMYDCAYSQAYKDIYAAVYKEILDGMYQTYYRSILEDAKDTVDYDTWSDVLTNEYEVCSGALSDSYDICTDFSSGIYDLYVDVDEALLDGELDSAKEVVEDFREAIKKERTGE